MTLKRELGPIPSETPLAKSSQFLLYLEAFWSPRKDYSAGSPLPDSHAGANGHNLMLGILGSLGENDTFGVSFEG